MRNVLYEKEKDVTEIADRFVTVNEDIQDLGILKRTLKRVYPSEIVATCEHLWDVFVHRGEAFLVNDLPGDEDAYVQRWLVDQYAEFLKQPRP